MAADCGQLPTADIQVTLTNFELHTTVSIGGVSSIRACNIITDAQRQVMSSGDESFIIFC
jgi:hypothetical protein